MDLISRQAAVGAISSMFAPTPTQKDMVEDCLEIIENLPSAQPYTEAEIQKMQDLEQAEMLKAYECGRASAQPERKTGKWIYKNDLKQFFCDQCGEPSLTDDDVYIYDMYFPNFCPNCGADMRGEQDGSD